jgi:transcription termination/antitermination protein NusA
MQSTTLVSSFAEIAREKDIDRANLQLIVEEVFRTMIKKRYGADDNFDIVFNPDNGDIQIIHVRSVVDNYAVEDPVTEIEVRDAVKIDESTEVGDDVAEEVSIHDFGRRAVMMARQTFAQKIRDIEKENVFEEYADMTGEIVIGEVYQTRRKEVLVLHERTELLLPREEQIYRDRYRKGDMIRAVVKEVIRDVAGNPQVIISRADPEFMRRLFELEVPEIYDGIVEIKNIVREPGDRAKVAVVSTDDRIDPVGACVGMKGVRIHAVARELANEGIDIIPWTPDDGELIRRSLAPSHPISVELSTDSRGQKRAKVVVRADEVSQAIGKGGINIKLASRLTGYEIDIYREVAATEDDVDIAEFSDELPPEVIERLREVGIDSARAAIELTPEEFSRRTQLDAAATEAVLRVLRAEFDEE